MPPDLPRHFIGLVDQMRQDLAARDVPLVLSTFIVKFRRNQPREMQIANADVEFYYMPWMSIDDLPGVKHDSLDLDVERNVLTVRAERAGLDQNREMVSAERPRGVFSRQLFLGDNLDADRIEASYQDGVLRLTIPVAQKAKPRRIKIASGSEERTAINA